MNRQGNKCCDMDKKGSESVRAESDKSYAPPRNPTAPSPPHTFPRPVPLKHPRHRIPLWPCYLALTTVRW